MRKVIVSVPEPCHENWDAMTPAEKGRFCDSCQKTVIDFSQMSDSQMAAFFRKPTGSVCGRFHGDQLGREIEIPRKSLPWIKYFFQFSLPAFLFSMKSYSQKDNSYQHAATTRLNGTPKLGFDIKLPHRKISGTIVDISGAPIPYATVSLKDTSLTISSDEKGTFQMEVYPKYNMITVTAIGYETVDQFWVENEPFKVVMKQKVAAMDTVVIEIPYGTVRRKYFGGATSCLRVTRTYSLQWLKDTIAPEFSFYPNPARPNFNVTIQPIKLEAGNYAIYIFDSKGAVVKISNMSLQDKKQTEQLALGSLIPGTYILCLRNKQTGKQYTKKLIVQ